MGKRGQKPIDIPENFKEFYRQAKIDQLSDRAIGNMFFVSRDTVMKWKKQVGIGKRELMLKSGRPKKTPPEHFVKRYLEFKEQKIADYAIAKEFFVCTDTLLEWKREAGLISKRG